MNFRRAEDEIAVIANDAAAEVSKGAKDLVKGFWASILWPILKSIIIQLLQQQTDKIIEKIKSSETIEVRWKE